MRGQYRRQDIALMTVTRRVMLPVRTERDRPIQQGRGERGSNNSLSSILEELPVSLSRRFCPSESLHREVLTGWSLIDWVVV